MRRRLRQLHADQSGFTLPELLTAMVLGLIVLLAAALLLDSSVSRSNEIADRQDAIQRGRQAMEIVARNLRSQVCLKDQRPIVIGENERVQFYADLSETDAIKLRTIRYDATSKRLVEDVVAGVGTFPDLTFPGAATTRWVLDGVQPVTGVPIFRYYGYPIGGAPGDDPVLMGTPLTLANRQRVVLIKVAFVALPTRTKALSTAAEDSTTFETDVYVRLADPTKPTDGPRCL
jgi:prepilin-type N-terminal cleavage/methylation domain-containing protein